MSAETDFVNVRYSADVRTGWHEVEEEVRVVFACRNKVEERHGRVDFRPCQAISRTRRLCFCFTIEHSSSMTDQDLNDLWLFGYGYVVYS